MHFLGYCISVPRGCCAPKFLYALEIDQALSAHTPIGMGVPPKKFNRENEKPGLKFSVLDSITSGLVGVSSRDFFQTTPREAAVINWVQCLQCPSPKICIGQKIAQNFSRFLTTFEFDRECLRNGSTYQKSEKLLIIYNPSYVRRKKFGELWSTNEKVIESNTCTP